MDQRTEAGPSEITALLDRVAQGDKAAENRLYELVIPELRRIAHGLMSRERPGHTLQATELVNRLYLRMSGSQIPLRNRGHFFAIAVRGMRRELIDYARRRPDAPIVPIQNLPEGALGKSSPRELALAIDQLLDQMQATMPAECAIVELKFFFGMTDTETAETLNLPLRTMQGMWQDARIWLFERAEKMQWKPTTNG